MSTFRVGERVLCVNAQLPSYPCPTPGSDWGGNMDGLEEKTIYTIRELDHDPYLDIPVVRLAEIRRGLDPYLRTEAAYDAARFRKLIIRSASQDMELFQPWLNPDPIDVCDIYERDFTETEARLSALWNAMGRFEL